MSDLIEGDSIKWIIEKAKMLYITAYEFGLNTKISAVTAHNILTLINRNPRAKTLGVMVNYIESKLVGTDITSENPLQNALNEEGAIYPKITKDRVVPYYDIEIVGSIITSFDDAKQYIKFYIDYKPLNDCTAYLPYYGNSMLPMFASGNTLGVKQLTNFDIILFGEPHLIITNQRANSYKTVKCIHKHKDDSKLILRAVNPDYAGDIVINKEDILSLFIVKGRIELNEL